MGLFGTGAVVQDPSTAPPTPLFARERERGVRSMALATHPSLNLETGGSAPGAAGERKKGGPLQLQRQKCKVLLAVSPWLSSPWL